MAKSIYQFEKRALKIGIYSAYRVPGETGWVLRCDGKDIDKAYTYNQMQVMIFQLNECTVCGGDCEIVCPVCEGEMPECPNCENGVVECPRCHGTGLEPSK